MAQYQEGQYISQFLNTLPQQLLQHSQYKEGQRQFDVSSAQRSKEFDAMQSLRDRAAAIAEEDREYNINQRTLWDTLLQDQRSRGLEEAEAEERKLKALEDRGWFEKMYQLGSGLSGKPMPYQYQKWSETDHEWAQRISGYDLTMDRDPMDLPEGLTLNPQSFQYINQLSGYQHPRTNLLNLTAQIGGR